MDTKAVLHVKDIAVSTPIANLAGLRERMYLAFAYEEVLGETTYRHYDVWGMKRVKRANLGASSTPEHHATVLP